jgi:hypothetical protein
MDFEHKAKTPSSLVIILGFAFIALDIRVVPDEFSYKSDI